MEKSQEGAPVATNSDLFTPEELAGYLKLPSVETIYAWRSRRRGPKATRVGRYIRFRKVDVDVWLEAGGHDAA
jgi:excisionase family DNA binding protein